MAEPPDKKLKVVTNVTPGAAICTPPRTKKKRLSLSKKRLSPKSRYQPIKPVELAQMAKGFTPGNTAKCTDWAVKNFESWMKQRNSTANGSESPCPEDILTNCPESSILCRWLSFFVTETRRVDGSPYPPKTLYQLLCGLLRFMRSHNPAVPNFLDRSDHTFVELHNVCDSLFRQLHSDGVGCESKETSIITKEEENLLWTRGILGLHSPKALVRTVFFYVGKMFCLRGREEQRALKLSQFQRMEGPQRYIYTEHGSKNRNGGYGHLKVKNKVVPVVSNPEAGDRCLVRILDFYISKLPPAAKEKDLFYMQPLSEVPANPDSPWFRNQVMGKNTLGNIVKAMCEEAGIEGKTNHSLRATGATEMYVSGVPEKVIQERTGHRSLDGLRMYERSTLEQHQAVSNIASSSSKSSYSKEYSRLSEPPADREVNVTAIVATTDETEEIKGEVKSLSTLFSCSGGGTFHFCPSGNVVINVNPAVTGISCEKEN